MNTNMRVLGGLLLMAASLITGVVPSIPAAAALTAPSESPGRVCDNPVPGPASPPVGALVVDPAVDLDLYDKTIANPPGTTFWLAPGTHTLGTSEFGQIIPKDGDTYLGAPGAILDGRGVNRAAFTQHAQNVTIRYLTIQNFDAFRDQGVVNHDSGDGWVIESDTIQNNHGAGMMAGANQQVRNNCLRNNGQYGINAYKQGDTITGLVVENNEIAGNNTDNWEVQLPGCGCTGGVKFWSVNGADVRSNWVHDNHSVGVWADTNNNDFLIEKNLISNNDGEGVFYEISYNLILRNNTLNGNAKIKGKQFADRNDDFPVAAVYLSESGGEPRIPARTDKIEIYGNMFTDNWSGITGWENADRFCNSPANTSTGYCTRLVPQASSCAQPGIASPPLYSDCRWKTQRLNIHDNTFSFNPVTVGCTNGKCGRMGLLSNYGTFPDWSPYKANVIPDAVTFHQANTWHNNTYTGPWTFIPYDTGRIIDPATWQATPYNQDPGSTFSSSVTPPDPSSGFAVATFETGADHHVPWFSSTVARDNADAHTGSWSLLTNSTSPWGSGVELDIWPGLTGIVTGQSYNFSVWYREATPTMPPVTWTIDWRREDGSLVRSDTVAMPRATTWTRAAGLFSAPTGATRLNWSFTWSVNQAGPAFRIDDLLVGNDHS